VDGKVELKFLNLFNQWWEMNGTLMIL